MRVYFATLTIFSVFLFLGMPHNSRVFAQGSEVDAVVAKWNSIGGFKANITVSRNNQKYGGVLSYQSGKMHFEFSDGRIVASTGRTLTAYSPVSRVAARQDLIPSGGGGLGWILTGYSREVSGKTAKLKAESPATHIQEIRLAWGDDLILNKISFRSKGSEDFTTIMISNLRRVAGFPSNLFSYKAPAGSRTVENPLHQRN